MIPNISHLPEGKKIYFASDFHLGTPSLEKSFAREKKIIKWLDEIKPTTHALFLVGDIFDFWFEYKHAIPKGFTRFLAKIAEFTDAGIPVYFFTGNHDMWMFDYFEQELNVKILYKPVSFSVGEKQFYVGHGDGLGPKDYSYKLLKWFFASKVCQFLFARVHPNFGIGLATMWSRRSRLSNTVKDDIFLHDKEWLYIYSNEVEAKKHHDYYIFGHRHLPLEMQLKNENARYVNIGEWVNYYTYGVYDGNNLELLKYEV